MQRIIPANEIGIAGSTDIQRLRLPRPDLLFAARAARLRALAPSNVIGAYLEFAAAVAQAQHEVVAAGPAVAPLTADALADAMAHGVPVCNAALLPDPAWRSVLSALLVHLQQQRASLPEAFDDIAARLRDATPDELDEQARAALAGAPLDLRSSPLLMAALQVVYAIKAASLDERAVPLLPDTPAVCPVCASPPVAAMLRQDDKHQPYRYQHCCVCESEWHVVQAKCGHCGSLKGISQLQVEGGSDTVRAESCDECGVYFKLVSTEKDDKAEALADDLGSLTLDLLMAETPYRRLAANPLLALGDEAAR